MTENRRQEKICLVTGSTSGIGKVTARELASRGATVVLVSRSRAKGEATQAEIKQATGNQHVELLVADLSLLEDVRRLLAERKISIELTEAAKELLFTEGYDPNFGARPLKRAIQKLIQDPLALKILGSEVLHGDHVVVDADKNTGKLRFEVSRRVGEPVQATR